MTATVQACCARQGSGGGRARKRAIITGIAVEPVDIHRQKSRIDAGIDALRPEPVAPAAPIATYSGNRCSSVGCARAACGACRR
ncbi:hypothetical protein XPU_0312 [Xanthomonas arboricola pv. pruni str. MAFF 311562]|uniref:Uncharacterized protein n=1 Tax=Xanthomonas arboricola pv. pruni str. MAFF 311562 TaxID=1414836 RepID=W4RWJ8_9XANT|nr:hypothetical protein XPU_0312 [Xanthomonas arboricola pv. pruni str. MAFF 311562]